MPRTPNEVPVYRRHKPSKQAVCTVRLPGGTYKQLYLGKYKSAASKAEYSRVVELVSANDGIYPVAGRDLTVNEAMIRFVKHCDEYYVDAAGSPTGTAADLKITLGYLKRSYGGMLLAEFNPVHLKVLREQLIADGRVRSQVNKRIGHVRLFYRWCVESMLVPPAVLDTLRAVRPLAPGRCGAAEGKPVEPANPADVEKVIPKLPPAVRAIVQLLRFSGCRPSEIATLRACDLDRSKEIWAYTPPLHKGAWRGKARVIYFGPQAQAVLAPWLVCSGGPEEYVFSPKRSEELRSRERAESRATPQYPSHMARNKRKRVGRRLADRYNHRALAYATRRACRLVGVKPFSLYSLRHLRAVELRERFGLEYVRATLGHTVLAMSGHYAKAADAALASKVAAEVG
jgi:integrase